jgi:hypothetical protein
VPGAVHAMNACACKQRCGRPAKRHGLSEACARRWVRAGRPEGGPPPPMTRKETLARAQAAKRPVDDGIYKLLWDADDAEITRWAAVDPKLRRARALAVLPQLVQMVAVGDRQGVEILLSRQTDWGALLIMAALRIAGLEARQRQGASAA